MLKILALFLVVSRVVSRTLPASDDKTYLGTDGQKDVKISHKDSQWSAVNNITDCEGKRLYYTLSKYFIHKIGLLN